MADKDIGIRVGIDGEADFQSAIKAMNSGIATLGQEMKLLTENFKGNENSEEALTAKSELLGRTITANQDKVALLSSKLNDQKARLEELRQKMIEANAANDNSATANEDTAKAAANAAREFNKQQSSVNALEKDLLKAKTAISSAENAQAELGDETKKTGDEMDDAGKKSSTFGDMLKANLASEAIIGGVKAIGGAVKELGSQLLQAASDAGYWADDLNTQAKVTGISTEQLQKYAFAAEQVDVSVDTIAGSMTKLTKNMNAARDGSGAAAEGFQKLGISVTDANGELRSNDEVFSEAIKALGEIENETERDAVAMEIFGKSAQDLNPLILGGVDALDEYSKMAEEAGLILSQDSLDSLNGISDALDTFKATAGAAGNLFMVGFAGPISNTINQLTGYMQRLTAAFADNGFEGLLTEGGAVLDELMGEIADILPDLMEKGTEILMSVVQGILEAAPDLLNTAATMIVTLAEGIGKALPQLIPAAVKAVTELAKDLTNPDSLGRIIEAALQIILGLVKGIAQAIPELIKAAPEIIKNLVTTLIREIPQVWEAGKQIVAGIWQGIQSAKAAFVANVKSFFSGIIASVKSVLGIASPSKVFRDQVGKQMAAGIGVGFSEEIGAVAKKISRGMDAVIPTIDVNGSYDYSAPAFGAAQGFGVRLQHGLEGVGVYLDGVKVGSLVSLSQSNTAKAMA